MSSNPIVSVITVCFNASLYLEQTILSVLSQDYENVEYIIIDGGSTDGTVDIIKKYENRIAHWISEPDKGVYDAMNKGVSLCHGYWVNFMNAGDYFASDTAIREIINMCEDDSDVVYGNRIMRLRMCKYIDVPGPIRQIEKMMPIGHQATFAKKELLAKYPFDLQFRSSADFDFLRKVYFAGYKYQYLPVLVADYYGAEGISTNRKQAIIEDAKIIGIYGSLIGQIIISKNLFFDFIKRKMRAICPSFCDRLQVQKIRRKYQLLEVYI